MLIPFAWILGNKYCLRQWPSFWYSGCADGAISRTFYRETDWIWLILLLQLIAYPGSFTEIFWFHLVFSILCCPFWTSGESRQICSPGSIWQTFTSFTSFSFEPPGTGFRTDYAPQRLSVPASGAASSPFHWASVQPNGVADGVAWCRLSTIGPSPKIRLPKFLCSGHRLARTLEGSPFHMRLENQQVRQTEPRNHGNQEKPTKIKKLQQLEFWNDIFVSHSSTVFFSPPPASKPRSAGGGQDGGPGRPLPGRLDPSPKFSALNQNESKDVQRMPDVSMSHDLIRWLDHIWPYWTFGPLVLRFFSVRSFDRAYLPIYLANGTLCSGSSSWALAREIWLWPRRTTAPWRTDLCSPRLTDVTCTCRSWISEDWKSNSIQLSKKFKGYQWLQAGQNPEIPWSTCCSGRVTIGLGTCRGTAPGLSAARLAIVEPRWT